MGYHYSHSLPRPESSNQSISSHILCMNSISGKAQVMCGYYTFCHYMGFSISAIIPVTRFDVSGVNDHLNIGPLVFLCFYSPNCPFNIFCQIYVATCHKKLQVLKLISQKMLIQVYVICSSISHKKLSTNYAGPILTRRHGSS